MPPFLLVLLAILVTVNLQSSFLTPPEVTIKDIYKGVVPFILLQGVTLVLVFFYPQLALWLPKAIGW